MQKVVLQFSTCDSENPEKKGMDFFKTNSELAGAKLKRHPSTDIEGPNHFACSEKGRNLYRAFQSAKLHGKWQLYPGTTPMLAASRKGPRSPPKLCSTQLCARWEARQHFSLLKLKTQWLCDFDLSWSILHRFFDASYGFWESFPDNDTFWSVFLMYQMDLG